MDNRHRGIASFALPHQQKGKRLSDDHAASEHNNVSAGNFGSALDEEPLAAEGSARDKTSVVAKRQLRHVRRVETIDVLGRIERANNCRFVDVLRWRGLHQDPMNRGIGIELFNSLQQLALSGLGWKLELHGMEIKITAHLVLRTHVST